MKMIFTQLYKLKGYYRYIFILLVLSVVILDLFIGRPEEITGSKIKFLWGIIIFFVSLFSIIVFKIVSFISYREDS